MGDYVQLSEGVRQDLDDGGTSADYRTFVRHSCLLRNYSLFFPLRKKDLPFRVRKV